MIDYLMMNILKYLCLKDRFEMRLISKQFFRLVNRLKDEFNEREELFNITNSNFKCHYYLNAIMCSQIEYIKFRLAIDETGIVYCDVIEKLFKSKHFEEIINLFNRVQFLNYKYVIEDNLHVQIKMSSEHKRIIEKKCEHFNTKLTLKM